MIDSPSPNPNSDREGPIEGRKSEVEEVEQPPIMHHQHHHLTVESYKNSIDHWEDKISSGNRCRECWLRDYDCYCSYLNACKRDKFPFLHPEEKQGTEAKDEHERNGCAPSSRVEKTDQFSSREDSTTTDAKAAYSHPMKIEFIMYYHFQEIGRSANTCHVLQSLYGPVASRGLIYGDRTAEEELAREIRESCSSSLREGAVIAPSDIAVLYPSRDAAFVEDWVKSVEEYRKSSLEEEMQRLRFSIPDQDLNTQALSLRKPRNGKLRVVLIDGTYAHAARMVKYLQQLLGNEIRLPVVKLNLGGGGCKSSMVGIMYQPNPEKICTFQAAVLALREAGEDPSKCDALAKELDNWVEYILVRKIKIGKVKVRMSNRAIRDYSPSEIVRKHLLSNPPRVGSMKLMTTKPLSKVLYVPERYEEAAATTARMTDTDIDIGNPSRSSQINHIQTQITGELPSNAIDSEVCTNHSETPSADPNSTEKRILDMDTEQEMRPTATAVKSHQRTVTGINESSSSSIFRSNKEVSYPTSWR